MEQKNHAGTYQQVYRKLREEILHLELPPGTSIGEIETAARFQTSRTPLSIPNTNGSVPSLTLRVKMNCSASTANMSRFGTASSTKI